jgi:NTP pyrophosphatase (non-canonical NTP hydrolase)
MNLAELTDRAEIVRQGFATQNGSGSRPLWGPTEVMQGFMGDVGDLAKLVLARNGFRDIPELDKKLEHELADCLWSVLVLARHYGIDLETAFERTMVEIETKLGK